jgi:hypothetical protein
MGKNKNKTVPTERHRFTNSEREYVKGMVQNLSFQRWTDQEIVHWLHEEKQIDIGRSTVSKIRKRIERQAEKWYIELRESRYKYIAIYKERLDSLYYYQKRLNQIVDHYMNNPSGMIYTDTVIRAISELHRIEMSIFSLWKQLPDLDNTNEPTIKNNNHNDDGPVIDEYDSNGMENKPDPNSNVESEA